MQKLFIDVTYFILPNRHTKFIQNGVTHFYIRASTEILKAKSKDNVKDKDRATAFLTKAIDVSLKPGYKALGAACGSIVTAPALVTGKILKFLVEAKNETDQHNNAKNIEKLLAGFNPEDAEWIKFLVAVFHDIFKAYNLQVRL